MISIIKYLTEYGDTSTYDPGQQGLLTGAYKYWTGGRTGADVREAVSKQKQEHAFNLARVKREHADQLAKIGKKGSRAASGVAGDMSGSEAAGHALKKGAESAGEAVGSFGKKAMEFAGEHSGAAGLAAGGLAAYALAKRNKNQT